jgi:hypothetical protein
MRKNNGKREFMVKWKNYAAKENTWETEENLSLNCKDEIAAFLKADKKPDGTVKDNKRKSSASAGPAKKKQSLPPKSAPKAKSTKRTSESPVKASTREVHVSEDKFDKAWLEKESWESDVQSIKNIEKGKQGYAKEANR